MLSRAPQHRCLLRIYLSGLILAELIPVDVRQLPPGAIVRKQACSHLGCLRSIFEGIMSFGHPRNLIFMA